MKPVAVILFGLLMLAPKTLAAVPFAVRFPTRLEGHGKGRDHSRELSEAESEDLVEFVLSL